MVLLYWSGADAEMPAKKREEKLRKAEKDALYDGYFAIITSEQDYDAAKIREVYHGLWRIEESFWIMKSDFEARPIYLNKREHIQAHFLICFMSLVIIRLIQHSMGAERLSAGRIAEALRKAECLLEKGGYIRLLDVGGEIGYQEILDRKSGKLVPA